MISITTNQTQTTTQTQSDKKAAISVTHEEMQYINLVKDILSNGERREDRTGTGTLSLFAPAPMKFDLSKGFPLLTTKRVGLRVERRFNAGSNRSYVGGVRGTDVVHPWTDRWADLVR